MNFSYQGQHPPAKLAAMATATPPSPYPYPHQTTWVLDTGATDHFTPDLHNIPDNQAYTDSQLVSVGNGNQLPISHSGNAQLRTSSHIFRLRKILRVPSMKSNLLSVQKFCRDNGTSFYFDAHRFQIQDLLTRKPFTRVPVKMASTQLQVFLFHHGILVSLSLNFLPSILFSLRLLSMLHTQPVLPNQISHPLIFGIYILVILNIVSYIMY